MHPYLPSNTPVHCYQKKIYYHVYAWILKINDFITVLPTFICLKRSKTTKQKADEQGNKKKREENENELKT